jgi:hypothetical protein
VTTGYAWGTALLGLLLGLVVANLSKGQGSWQFYTHVDLLLEALALSLLASLLGVSGGVLISLRSATVRQAQQLVIVATLVLIVAGVVVIKVLPAQAVSSLSTSQIWLVIMAVLAVLDVQSANTDIPDAAAAYWGQPIVADQNTTIQISGRSPDARYASLSVYTPYGSPFTTNGVSSSLPDYRIRPQPGSQNPWQQPARPGGSFEVTISPSVTPNQVNALPMPAGTSSQHPGYRVYRVYLTASGNFSQVQLPALTIEEGHVARPLPACATHNTPVQKPERAPTSGTPTSTPTTAPVAASQFYSPPFNGGLANADTAYVEAYFIRPAASDVVVVTAKALTYPHSLHPTPWPDPNADMRYWSMCIVVGIQSLPTVVNTLSNGTTDYGCRADDATKTNADGDYTYVIGTETQRTAIERLPGVTFLPFSSTESTRLYLLLLRNTLVSPQFTHSVQDVTQTLDPTAAAAAMGPYYPQVSTCPLTTLMTSGPQACTSGQP